MKTKTLSSLGLRGVLVAVAAVVAFASVVMLAYADTAPTITTTAYNPSYVSLTSAPIGTNVLVSASLASTSSTTLPTGSVTFTRYANTSCTGTATVQAGVPLVNGVATSSVVAMTAGGLSYITHYNGDAFNVAADGVCKSIAATATGVSIAGTLSTTTAVLAGSSITESAVLSNATSNAGGSVTYTVYSNNACTTLWGNAGSKTVTNASVPTSDPFLFNIPGTYYWQVVYSGDASNSVATSSCVSLSVVATSTPPATGPGVISGKVFNDANDNDMLDGAEAGVAGFTVNLYGQSGWWGKKGQFDPIKTAVTDASGNYSFGSLSNGTYSIELIKKSGWKQTSDDFKSVVLSNNSFSDKNFAVQSASSTKNGNGHDKHKDHDKDGKGNNGKHKGWQKFLDRFGHLPWGIMKKQ